jgi:thiol-disulfide isomerase/thioredoxin
MFTEITEDNLKALVSENKKVYVQFSAGWCGNCRIMKPKFKRMASEHEDTAFVVVDAEKFPESRQLANVNNLPTFAFFEGGEFKQQIQTNKIDSLKKFVDETSSN